MERKILYYTFGNHMHWADFHWLWGHGVLPESTRDMLVFCREAGVRGNVNFEGFGYERMAAECPEVLQELREAVSAGTVEPVGGSWGQPYGLFQGGESNARQLTFGARAVRRHLGRRPISFWEEEFYFFPQLPQLLAGCGYRGACLFFQWTWHTPEVPLEEHALVQWEGFDGTRLPTLPRNSLNLHQWPEDFEPILGSPLLNTLERPALVQWIELMPSPEWMCRSELLLPEMKALAEDPRFELRPRTLSALVEDLASEAAPIRHYSLDDVWHGMSLGKNADFIPRTGARVEASLLAAEILASLAGLCGRPYPSWDVYPLWEIEEAWRELLIAQHHDNHECEGFCGFIGHDQFDRAERLAERVSARSLHAIARRLKPERGEWVVANPLGWRRDVYLGEELGVAPEVPPLGFRQVKAVELRPGARATIRSDPSGVVLERSGTTLRLGPDHPGNWQLEHASGSLSLRLDLGLQRDGRAIDLLAGAELDIDPTAAHLRIARETDGGDVARLELSGDPIHEAILVQLVADHQDPPDPGVGSALVLELRPFPLPAKILHDHPFGISEVAADRDHRRKYPGGDWMTSEQWFETVSRPFSALQFVDLLQDDGSGLLLVHDGSQGWQRLDDGGVRVALNANDPWDEEYWRSELDARLWLCPHGPLSNLARLRLVAELRASARYSSVPPPRGTIACVGGGSLQEAPPLPPELSAAEVEGPAALTAFHREGPRSGEGFPEWAGHGMNAPHVVRLVELDGAPAEVRVSFAGGVSAAWRTNLLGERLDSLVVTEHPPVDQEQPARSSIGVALRPNEVVTCMVDLDLARKQSRDLDEKRKVWASIHRDEGGTP